MYPKGFWYFALEIKIRYSHKKLLIDIKTKISETRPNERIFAISNAEKEDCVMG